MADLWSQPESVIFVIVMAAWLFWMWMLLECISLERLSGRDRFGWIVILATTYLLGATLYFFIRRPHRIKAVGI